MKRGVVFDVDNKKKKLLSLEAEMGLTKFWDNQERAKAILREAALFKEEIETAENLCKDIEDLLQLVDELIKDSVGEDGELFLKEIQEQYQKLWKKYQELEQRTLFSGRFDSAGAIVAIHAGTGGVDAQDWTGMILRMYLRFIERHKWKAVILDKQIGNEAGIKSVTVEVEGAYAYGFLKCEAGVHRLVRISPFDAEKMRHTSFALVEVVPDLGDAPEIQIKDDDLRIDTFRSSGAGGQSVNKTDSAVRIVHIPTHITVTCQSERSQHQNKDRALRVLKAKLYQLEEANQNKTKEELRGRHIEAKWGNQIRSYVLEPYKQVKDHRTGYETSSPESVLNGDIDAFIKEYLKKLK